MTFRYGEQERRVEGPIINVLEVLSNVMEDLEAADSTPGDTVDDFINLISVLAAEPGHQYIAVSKARQAALRWLESPEVAYEPCDGCTEAKPSEGMTDMKDGSRFCAECIKRMKEGKG